MGNQLIVDKDILTVSSDNSSNNISIRTIHFRRRYGTTFSKKFSKTFSKKLQINGNIISCSAFGNIIIDKIENNIIHCQITPELINGVIVVVYSAN